MKKLVKLTIVLAAIGAAAYHINKQFEALEITVAATKRKQYEEPETDETTEETTEETPENAPEEAAPDGKEETKDAE